MLGFLRDSNKGLLLTLLNLLSKPTSARCVNKKIENRTSPPDTRGTILALFRRVALAGELCPQLLMRKEIPAMIPRDTGLGFIGIFCVFSAFSLTC